ncbi:hypothetical protein [Rubrivirga sp.]|uniref:hypothetical protein n=1 Tax=Rubrivirga sp. TaxID=1885344 RepID=UPI003C761BDA
MRYALLLLFLAGCAPRLSPPYRDYEVRSASPALVEELRAAVLEAGWELAPSTDSLIVATAPRQVASGILSDTEAFLSLVPLDGGFVRVYVRAESKSVLGGRTKVYAMQRDLQRSVLEELTAALESRGLVPLGTPRTRDEDATDEAP